MSTALVNLLDVITDGRTLPDGYDQWALRSVRPDFTSRNGFRYPFPGGVATAPGPILHGNKGGCPNSVGDGLCAATTWQGMASGGIPARTLLLVAYRGGDMLGGESTGKLRLSEMLVCDVIDGERLVREHGAGAYLGDADLGGADLRGAYLGGAYLREWARGDDGYAKKVTA